MSWEASNREEGSAVAEEGEETEGRGGSGTNSFSSLAELGTSACEISGAGGEEGMIARSIAWEVSGCVGEGDETVVAEGSGGSGCDSCSCFGAELGNSADEISGVEGEASGTA